MDRITEQLAAYASAARFEDLTQEAVRSATQRLLDSLGCAVGAHACVPAVIGRKLAEACPRTGALPVSPRPVVAC